MTSKTLDLRGEFERAKVLFHDGSECKMRTMDELSIAELKSLNKLHNKEIKIDDMQKILKYILIDPSTKQIESLPVNHARRIMDFFSAGAEELTNGSEQSQDSSDSMADQSENG